MIGKVLKYNDINETGYIAGFDEITYFFHQVEVIGNKKLEEGNIVRFEYILEKNNEQLPYAINIIKEEKKKNTPKDKVEEIKEESNYDVDIFANNKKKEINKNVALIVQEEKNCISKVIEFIKNIFKKK